MCRRAAACCARRAVAALRGRLQLRAPCCARWLTTTGDHGVRSRNPLHATPQLLHFLAKGEKDKRYTDLKVDSGASVAELAGVASKEMELGVPAKLIALKVEGTDVELNSALDVASYGFAHKTKLVVTVEAGGTWLPAHRPCPVLRLGDSARAGARGVVES